MTGFFQTTFYFGYTLMFCIGEQGVEMRWPCVHVLLLWPHHWVQRDCEK